MKNKKWITASGLEVPANRVTAYEKKREKVIEQLSAEAEKLSEQLKKFKSKVFDLSKNVLDMKAIEENIDLSERKGNFTLSSFDKNVRIEISIQERIVFADEDLVAAKKILDEFLNSKISASAQVIKNIVMDAFQTTRGRVDTRKVLGLLAYKHRIDDPQFQQACELLEKAQDREGSKSYARISKKNAKGEYEYINLNFASVEVE